MGIFQTIFTAASGGLYKKQRRLQNAQAQKQIDDVQRAIDTRATEDPREQASLKQGLWGRGLGKSTIAEQDTQRLSDQQTRRNQSLAQAMDIAHKNKQYLKSKAKYDRTSMYIGILDSIISIAAGAGGGNTAAPPGGGGGGGYGSGGYDYGSYSDYGYGGGNSNYG